MDITTAKNIIAKYTRSGYLTPAGVGQMPLKEFEAGVKVWPVEYLEAVLTLAKAWNFEEHFNLEKHGKTDITEWGCRAKEMREVIAFKKTTEGKQRMLRTIAPTEYRTEEKDKEENMKDMSVQVAASGFGRTAKKQTKLNIQRMEHLKALEKSISKGGALRDMYDRTIEDYNRKVDNLPTNEEAAQAVMKSKRKNRVPSLILFWLTAPLYGLLKGLDFLFDSAFWCNIKYTDFDSKMGGEHPFLGRIETPMLISTFISAASAYVESMTSSGIDKTAFTETFISTFPILLICIVIARNLLGIATHELSNLYGKLLTVFSNCFESISANDYQMCAVSKEMDYANEFASQIKEREDIIEDLRTIINEDQPYGYVDEFLKGRKDLSMKRLAQDEIDNEIIKKQRVTKKA